MDAFIPYGHQIIDADDIKAVTAALSSDWLTTGPLVSQFEQAVCAYTGAKFAVALSSGTAALHLAMLALDIKNGDEVIVPPITFAATSNAVLYCGGTPVFVDVDADTLLIDPAKIEAAITPRTKAIIAVDYAGQPCAWEQLQAIAHKHGLRLVADACHALGAEHMARKVGTLADITVFSFHPVKHITTGEGGMCVTDDKLLAQKISCLRSHGITTDSREREAIGAWFYEMSSLGFNYRLTDLQCALGLSQLEKLPFWLEKRTQLAAKYAEEFYMTGVRSLLCRPEARHAYHLYVVRVKNRNACYELLRKNNIGTNVHYIPVYLHPYYRSLGYAKGLCPVAEQAYEEILTLPLWAGMTLEQAQGVADILKAAQ